MARRRAECRPVGLPCGQGEDRRRGVTDEGISEVRAPVTAEQEAAAGGEPPPDVRERHAELSQELNEHQYRYYVLSSPTVDDATYDRQMHELEAIEQRYPSLVT